MEAWMREQNILIMVAVVLMVLTAIFFVYKTMKHEKDKKDKYMNVLYPSEEVSKERHEKNVKKKNKVKLLTKFNAYLDKKGVNKKFESWYLRAGKKGKTSKDFIFDCMKSLIIGVGCFFIMYFLVQNLLIAGLIGIIIVALPPITLYSKIKGRESSFRNDFPYFLQTIAFVLKNGTNFSQAFYEVVNKQEDTVLKEVMLDVLTIQNVNAGDYKLAFQSMVDKVKIEEVSEFVNVVVDNLEKGVSVSDVFLNQARNTSKQLNLSIKKKISAVSTKILLPILLMCGAVGILFISL